MGTVYVGYKANISDFGDFGLIAEIGLISEIGLIGYKANFLKVGSLVFESIQFCFYIASLILIFTKTAQICKFLNQFCKP